MDGREITQLLTRGDTANFTDAEVRISKGIAGRLGFTKDADDVTPGNMMIAWFPSPALASGLAQPGGVAAEDLHVTLVHLAGPVDADVVNACALLVSKNCAAIDATISGTGRFCVEDNLDAIFVTVDAPGLIELRAELISLLVGMGHAAPSDDHGFVPHITLEYCPRTTPSTYNLAAAVGCTIDALSVVGPAPDTMRNVFPLVVPEAEVAKGELEYTMVKSLTRLVKNDDGEYQYSLGPVYTPGQLDAHDEYANDDVLHASMMEYSLGGDRNLRLQHNTDITAGRWVEIMRLPAPMTAPVTKADGTSTEVTFPAGTIMMGVLWSNDVWPYVKSGQLGGLSMGGRALRVRGQDGTGMAPMGYAPAGIAKAADVEDAPVDEPGDVVPDEIPVAQITVVEDTPVPSVTAEDMRAMMEKAMEAVAAKTAATLLAKQDEDLADIYKAAASSEVHMHMNETQVTVAQPDVVVPAPNITVEVPPSAAAAPAPAPVPAPFVPTRVRVTERDADGLVKETVTTRADEPGYDGGMTNEQGS